jgi:hypothetical protein
VKRPRPLFGGDSRSAPSSAPIERRESCTGALVGVVVLDVVELEVADAAVCEVGPPPTIPPCRHVF